MSLRTAAKSPLGLIAAFVLCCFVLNLYPKHYVSGESLVDTCQAKIYGLQSGERSGEIYISGENSGKTTLNYKPISFTAFTILFVVVTLDRGIPSASGPSTTRNPFPLASQGHLSGRCGAR